MKKKKIFAVKMFYLEKLDLNRLDKLLTDKTNILVYKNKANHDYLYVESVGLHSEINMIELICFNGLVPKINQRNVVSFGFLNDNTVIFHDFPDHPLMLVLYYPVERYWITVHLPSEINVDNDFEYLASNYLIKLSDKQGYKRYYDYQQQLIFETLNSYQGTNQRLNVKKLPWEISFFNEV